VGAGKTAVLVQLTKLFAQHHAVPVPIRLRDAEEELNFREMAHTRFLAMAESSMLSADDAEKVWRQLSKDDKIVVIADGLDEPGTTFARTATTRSGSPFIGRVSWACR
jgi:hypothetical protein